MRSTDVIAQLIRPSTATADTPTGADAGKLVTLANAAAVTVTVNAALALAAGQRIDFAQTGAGQVTFVGSGAAVHGTPGLKLRAQWSGASLICLAANDYLLVGDLA